ncbi:uncharacterized protein LOC135389479 [Ornithodoros turicata]|uniref:uncharacterized protein LOC135389479 n=1 Tax=Ornithodoros turicata TaxID=34597 RepID=UPI00313A470B
MGTLCPPVGCAPAGYQHQALSPIMSTGTEVRTYTTLPSRTTAAEPEFQKQVVRSLHVIQLMLQHHGGQLDTLVAANANPSSCAGKVIIPTSFDNLDDFKRFNKRLTEAEKVNLVSEFQQLGGNDVKKCTSRVLSYIITREVGQHYSWEGRSGKEKFMELNVAPVIIQAVKDTRREGKWKNSDIEDAIKNWLRHCPGTVKRRVEHTARRSIQPAEVILAIQSAIKDSGPSTADLMYGSPLRLPGELFYASPASRPLPDVRDFPTRLSLFCSALCMLHFMHLDANPLWAATPEQRAPLLVLAVAAADASARFSCRLSLAPVPVAAPQATTKTPPPRANHKPVYSHKLATVYMSPDR